jgi:3-isopropylmalate dehydrogenase
MLRDDKRTVCLLPGDGIGPEVLKPAIDILESVARRSGLNLQLQEHAIGGQAIDRYGVPLPEETLQACRQSDAVLLGAVGGPQWDGRPDPMKPEKGLLALRKELELFANIRPVRMIPSLVDCSTLRSDIVAGVDLVVVRELTGGLYFGTPRGIVGARGDESGCNTMAYHRREIERIARCAFEIARGRRKKVVSVDKANVLEVSALWRRVVEEVHREYEDVQLSHQYVDNCAMQMVLRPSQFDVLLTENMFGDILSDIGGVLTGSIGTLPSASMGQGTAVYEPVHGSAPDIAGMDVANPVGSICCVAMMLENSFGRADLARLVTQAVDAVLDKGWRTRDLCRAGARSIGTAAFGKLVLEHIGQADLRS